MNTIVFFFSLDIKRRIKFTETVVPIPSRISTFFRIELDVAITGEKEEKSPDDKVTRFMQARGNTIEEDRPAWQENT